MRSAVLMSPLTRLSIIAKAKQMIPTFEPLKYPIAIATASAMREITPKFICTFLPYSAKVMQTGLSVAIILPV